MFNAGIFDMEFSFEGKGVSRESVLSPFLFNIYMNELDVFVEKLIKEKYIPPQELSESRRSTAGKGYTQTANKFSVTRIKPFLKPYTTASEIAVAISNIKKEHQIKYSRSFGVDFQIRHIDYVRYADDYLIGIVGPKKFAIEVRSKVDQFVKGDLHLEIKKNDIVNRNEGAVKFLGFAVYLHTSHNKTSSKHKDMQSARKYKQRVLARLKYNNTRLANRQANLIKSNLLKSYRTIIEKLGLK